MTNGLVTAKPAGRESLCLSTAATPPLPAPRPAFYIQSLNFRDSARLPQLRRCAYNVARPKLRLQYLHSRVYVLSEDNSFHPHSTSFYRCAILVHYAAALRSVTKFCCALLIFCRSRSAFTACCARLAFVCRLATRCWSGISGLIGLAGWISDRRIGYLYPLSNNLWI